MVASEVSIHDTITKKREKKLIKFCVGKLILLYKDLFDNTP